MKNAEFAAAWAIARSPASLENYCDAAMYGIGLPHFRPVAVELGAVAKFLRWQCVCLNGGVDGVELEACRHLLVVLRRASILDAYEYIRKVPQLIADAALVELGG